MQLPEPLRFLPPLAGARALALLRDLPQRQVWRIRLDGHEVYLKHFRGPDGPMAAQGAHDRLCAAGAALDPARHAVTRPLLLIAAAGVLVTQPAAGQLLGALLARSRPEARAQLLARTGGWLADLAGASRDIGSFGPRFWIDGLRQRLEQVAQEDWLDAALAQAHLARMQEAAPGLRRAPVQRALLHGDLTGDNLFFDAATGRITGLDMQDWGPIAVARDVARLLVWLESRRAADTGPRIDGIAAADHRALCAVPELIAADQRPILRFMIAELLLAYYLDSARQPGRRAALAAAIRAWAQPGSASAAS